MRPEKLEIYRNLLFERMDNLLGTAGQTLDKLSSDVDLFADPVDRAMTESSNTIELRKRDRERKLLQKIKEAIQRTEDGTYGVCEECGEEISDSRLSVRPEATLCINCKEDQEKVEKKFGL